MLTRPDLNYNFTRRAYTGGRAAFRSHTFYCIVDVNEHLTFKRFGSMIEIPSNSSSIFSYNPLYFFPKLF